MYDEFSTWTWSLVMQFSLLIGDKSIDYAKDSLIAIYIVSYVFICTLTTICTGYEGVNRGEVITGRDCPVTSSIAPPQHVCEDRSLCDYCYVPSTLIRQDIDVKFVRLSVREMVLRPLLCW